MADEVASIYGIVRGQYRLLGDVQWNDPDVVPILSELLKGKGKRRPVKILYDMVEQYYRREVVPKVAMFDQAHVLNRRLMAAFPNYPMRRAFPLKDRADKGEGGGDKEKQIGRASCRERV